MAQESAAKGESSSSYQLTDSDKSDSYKAEESQIDKETESGEDSEKEKTLTESSIREYSFKSNPAAMWSTPTENKRREEAMRLALQLTMANFIDWNLFYLIRMRGILNIMHIILSLTIIITLGIACEMRPETDYENGYFCEFQETFLFFVTWFCCLTAVLYLVNCSLSKTTDLLLFNSDFELIYYGTCAGLLLYASVTAMITAVKSKAERDKNGTVYDLLQTEPLVKKLKGNDFTLSFTASVVGLANSAVYCMSVIWFFISHYFNLRIIIHEEEDENGESLWE